MIKHVLAICMAVMLTGCADRDLMPILPDAVQVGTPLTVFATTTREMEPDGTFGFGRSEAHPHSSSKGVR